MSQITIRKLPENLENQIRRLAQKNRSSLNKTIIELLAYALGSEDKKRDLSGLAASWSEDEIKEFESNTRHLEQIDEDIWKS